VLCSEEILQIMVAGCEVEDGYWFCSRPADTWDNEWICTFLFGGLSLINGTEMSWFWLG